MKSTLEKNYRNSYKNSLNFNNFAYKNTKLADDLYFAMSEIYSKYITAYFSKNKLTSKNRNMCVI